MIMSLDDDFHASSHHSTGKMKTRRSMDIEFHDHLDDDLLEELEDLDDDSSHPRKTRHAEDLDDDSFGEASDSMKPDQEYMEQILEECHPERLNLLEQTVPESVYMKAPRAPPPLMRSPKQASLQQEDDTDKGYVPMVRSTKQKSLIQDDDDEPETSEKPQSIEAKPASFKNAAESESSSDRPSPEPEKQDVFSSKATEESESNNEEETEDSFLKSPQKKGPRLGVDRSKLLGSMGKSTKKSLRTINGTFWSKPFKGLAQSIRRNGSAQGIADS